MSSLLCAPGDISNGEKKVSFQTGSNHGASSGYRRADPGSCGIVDAIDAYADGLQFRAIKVFDEGRRNDAVWQMLRDNIRASDLVVGDMEAQVAAVRIGAERMQALVARMGLRSFRGACVAMMDQSERMMRRAIAALPDGSWSAETRIDGYLDDPDPTRRELKLVARVTK